MGRIGFLLALFLISFPPMLHAQVPDTAAADTTPHKVRFLTVQKDVRLEVLDWGGTGPALIFLAGLGDTAHGFDSFAPRFSNHHHVYGVTRRGFGASSVPSFTDANYDADRLGDDVAAVIDALGIARAVIAAIRLPARN